MEKRKTNGAFPEKSREEAVGTLSYKGSWLEKTRAAHSSRLGASLGPAFPKSRAKATSERMRAIRRGSRCSFNLGGDQRQANWKEEVRFALGSKGKISFVQSKCGALRGTMDKKVQNEKAGKKPRAHLCGVPAGL